MILSCNNISKSFDGKNILDECSFHIEDHEKAAIVGINGAGKSTFFKIITGELPSDSGNVTISKDKSLAYLSQHPDVTMHNTIYEEMLTVKKDIIEEEQKIRALENEIKNLQGAELEAKLEQYSTLTHHFEINNGYAYKSEITGILKGLGFDEGDFDKKIETLSGGQKTRVFLSKILISNPDIILLDEPTNHLDLNSIAWLEVFLSNYKGSVIVISHDRYFLDKIVTKVIEIDNCHCRTYAGNYSDYAYKKEQLRDAMLKQYYNYEREVKHQEQVIEKLKSFNREKSIKRAESREKQLSKMAIVEKPVFTDDKMRLRLTPDTVSGNDVLTVKNLGKSFDTNKLFEDLSFEIKRGEKVSIIGNNGTGKTTILKIINQIIPSDNGEIKLGSNVTIGYYDQEHNVLHMDKTIFDEISDDYPDMTNTKIRNVLAAFLFTGDDVYKYIRDLSGGERGRVSLAKLMLSNANFLILDEPTNHLDIISKEILENAINSYEGTILYVSHDRYFINKTATRILDLVNKKLVNYIGNYDYYLEKKDELTKIYAAKTDISVEDNNISDNKLSWQAQKEEQAKLRKKQNEQKKIEDKINELESKISRLSEEMNNPEISSNVSKLTELSKEIDKANEELADLYEKWEEFI